MAYVLVHEEDWSSYGTDIDAAEDAYPVWDGSDPPLSTHGTTVGPSLGPGGGPGLFGPNYGSVMKNEDMTCREFKLEGQWDFTDWDPESGSFNNFLFRGWHGSPYSPSMSEFSDFLFSLQHNVSGTLTVTANPDYNSGNLADAIPTSGVVDVRVEGRMSTISGSPGTFSAAADGYFKVYVNEVAVVDQENIEFWHDDAAIPSVNADGNWSPYWNIVELGCHGKVGAWSVYASDSCLLIDSERNLLTGQGHTVTGSDNVICGADGTLVGDRSVLMSLDGSSHSETKTGALIVWGDIYKDGSSLDLSVDLSAEFDGLGT